MPGNLDDAIETAILKHLFGIETFVVVLPYRLRLVTALGTEATAGIEVNGSGNGYLPAALSVSITGDTVTNLTTVKYFNMPGVTIVGAEIWDSFTPSPRRIFHGTIFPSRTVSAGQDIEWAPGQLTIKAD